MSTDPRSPKRRTRNASATREQILAVATVHFTRDSFDRVGLRQIASDAGVDVALVARYFKTKENLFTEVLASTLSPRNLESLSKDDFGESISHALTDMRKATLTSDYYLLLIRAATTPFTLGLLHKMVDERVFEPFAAWLGGEDARLRTKLLLTFITGMSVHALVASGSDILTVKELERFRRVAADVMQRLVDNNLGDFLDLERPVAGVKAAG